MKPKKPRGRPKGTVIPTDRRTLNMVADLLLREPTMRPTTAIKRIVPDWTDSVIHRLMGKWRKEREALLAAALERQKAKAERPAAATNIANIVVGGSVGQLATQMRAIRESPSSRAVQEMMGSPAMKTIWEMTNSPAMRAIQELQSSPAMQAIWQLQDSPVMQIMREQQRLRRALGFF